MANPKDVAFLKKCAQDPNNGSIEWNEWRKANNVQSIDLSHEDLRGHPLYRYNLAGGDFTSTNLSGAILMESMFIKANLTGAILQGCQIGMANFAQATLTGADFTGSKLNFSQIVDCDCRGAKFDHTDLGGCIMISSDFSDASFVEASLMTTTMTGSRLIRADLRNCNMAGLNLTHADLSGANISGSRVFGVAAWGIEAKDLIQQDLIISNEGDPLVLTIDDIEIAQFIYLLSQSEKLGRVIDKITSKVVLILGRFTEERKAILDAIKDTLRQKDYIAVVFDFDKPESRTLTETVKLLARMSRFIVADITDPKCIPHELAAVVPDGNSVPIQPIQVIGTEPYSMFNDWKKIPWMLETIEYDSLEDATKRVVPLIIDSVNKFFDQGK